MSRVEEFSSGPSVDVETSVDVEVFLQDLRTDYLLTRGYSLTESDNGDPLMSEEYLLDGLRALVRFTSGPETSTQVLGAASHPHLPVAFVDDMLDTSRAWRLHRWDETEFFARVLRNPAMPVDVLERVWRAFPGRDYEYGLVENPNAWPGLVLGPVYDTARGCILGEPGFEVFSVENAWELSDVPLGVSSAMFAAGWWLLAVLGESRYAIPDGQVREAAGLVMRAHGDEGGRNIAEMIGKRPGMLDVLDPDLRSRVLVAAASL